MSRKLLREWSQWDEKICEVFSRFGLAIPDLEVSVCKTPAVLAYKAWREEPVRYSHWSQGKRLELLEDAARRGFLFLDVHGVPGRMAWAVADQSPASFLFSWTHTRAHHDFALRNRRYREALATVTPELLRTHARRIRAYIAEHGREMVERTITAAQQVRRQSGNEISPYGSMLGFLRSRANPSLAKWQREVLAMVDEEWPLLAVDEYTFLLSEGFSTFWQLEVLHALELPAPTAMELARMTAALLAVPEEPFVGFRPHLVGYRMCEELKATRGLGACLLAAEHMDDPEFVRAHLTKDVAERCGLGAAKNALRTPADLSVSELPNAPAEFEVIRETLAQSLGREAYPKVREMGKDREGALMLEHIFEGRYLDRTSARHVLSQQFFLWGKPVRIRFREKRKEYVSVGYGSVELWGWVEVEESFNGSDFSSKTLKPFQPFPPELQPR